MYFCIEQNKKLMKKLFLISFLIITTKLSFSQSPSESIPNDDAKIYLSGKVIDKETEQGLEYATVVLKPKNGNSITGGITD